MHAMYRTYAVGIYGVILRGGLRKATACEVKCGTHMGTRSTRQDAIETRDEIRF